MKSHLTIAACGALTALLLYAQTGTAPNGDWPMYNRDLSGMRFSPLDQINAQNAARLVPAWTYRLRTEEEREGPVLGFGFSEVTPIVVNGVMYITAGNRVIALRPETGEEIWRYTLEQGRPSNRGVAYWPGDASHAARIIYTAGPKMGALSAKTGQADPGFGNEGTVEIGVPYNSPPTVFRDKLFLGANVSEQPSHGPAGDTRAYSAVTGEKLWEFHSIPRAGEFGYDTWPKGGAEGRTGANHWGFSMTIDPEREILYTNYGSPASDYYGADREGNNLFGNSVVALNLNTGERLWHFQTVHHDIWDMDLPPAPTLMDIEIDGETVPVLAQTGKLGLIFILNRVTGEPIFGVEERPVPQSDVPGEHTSATQPFPVKPAPLGKHSFSMGDVVTAEDTNEAHAAACAELVQKSGELVNKGPYTPWVFRGPGLPERSTVLFPGAIGGTDWGGMSADPRLGYLFINTSDYGSIGWVEKMGEDAPVPYNQVSVYGNPVASKFWDRKTNERGQLMGASSWPCNKPPWGKLWAINAKTGEVAWEVVTGVTDELPEGKRNTGRINMGGSIATAGGLVFLGATNDKRFRAFDSRTGKELWSTTLEYDAISTPITYLGSDGKQYVAISASGGGLITDINPSQNESLYVFKLP